MGSAADELEALAFGAGVKLAEARGRDEPARIAGVLWVELLSSTTCTSNSAGTEASIRLRSGGTPRRERGIPRTIPEAMSSAAYRFVVPLRTQSWLRRSATPGQWRPTGADRLSPDLAPFVDAEHHRRLGRVEVEADDVAHLVDELRISGTSLNARRRCGLSPNARQIRLTADWLIPVAAAIDRVDQCVAPAGCSSSVFTITRSTSSSRIVRGLPGRGSSCKPSKRRRANRPRHLLTVLWLQPNSAGDPLARPALRGRQHAPAPKR